MSKSAKERDNPPPRRKSCSACVRAKRRCVYSVTLACLRCTQRNITCDFPSHRKVFQQQQQQAGTLSQHVGSMLGGLVEDVDDHLFLDTAAADVNAGIDISYGAINDFDTFLNESTVTGSEIIPSVDAGIGKHGFQFTLDDIDMNADMRVSLEPGLYGIGQPLIGDTIGYANFVSGGSYADDPDMGRAHDAESDALHYLDFCQLPAQASTTLIAPMARDLTFIPTILQQRLEYAIAVFRTAPRTMVHDIETPWSHPMLYRNGMPKCMQGKYDHPILILYSPANVPSCFVREKIP